MAQAQMVSDTPAVSLVAWQRVADAAVRLANTVDAYDSEGALSILPLDPTYQERVREFREAWADLVPVRTLTRRPEVTEQLMELDA